MARTDAHWVAFEVQSDRIAADVLPAFRIAARHHLCSIDRVCTGGRFKSCYGVIAHCHDKIIALFASTQTQRFTVGCLRPTTIAQCDALLTEIMNEP